jgi:hypothetical protein
MATSFSPHPFSQALQLTQQTIQTRAHRYRNLVVLTTMINLLSLLLALIQFSWRPLLGLFNLIPLYGLFIYRDHLLLNRWQQQLLNFWVQEHLDLQHFITTMTHFRHLPPRTLISMLDTLPPKSIYTIKNLSLPLRQALGLTLQLINRYQNRQMLLSTLMITIGVIALAGSLFLWSWLPLLILLLMPLVKITDYGLNRLELSRWQKYQLSLPKLEQELFVQLANQLDWQTLPKNQWLP